MNDATVTVNAARTLITRVYAGPTGDPWTTWFFWCPACARCHNYDAATDPGRPSWQFDGNAEAPTFTPSLRYTDGSCHLWVRAGVIEYCDDCPHAMRGQRVPLPPIPEDRVAWFLRVK